MSPNITPRDETEHLCLGCSEDTPAEYVWHDGLWPSYVCATHARKQLPKRGFDDFRESNLDRRGREGIVSGYATPLEGSGKVVWKDEVDIGSPEIRTDGGVDRPTDEEEQPVIEVDRQTYERFEEERQKTANESTPEMDQSTFLDSLLDTQKAAREGYYDGK